MLNQWDFFQKVLGLRNNPSHIISINDLQTLAESFEWPRCVHSIPIQFLFSSVSSSHHFQNIFYLPMLESCFFFSFRLADNAQSSATAIIFIFIFFFFRVSCLIMGVMIICVVVIVNDWLAGWLTARLYVCEYGCVLFSSQDFTHTNTRSHGSPRWDARSRASLRRRTNIATKIESTFKLGFCDFGLEIL